MPPHVTSKGQAARQTARHTTSVRRKYTPNDAATASCRSRSRRSASRCCRNSPGVGSGGRLSFSRSIFRSSTAQLISLSGSSCLAAEIDCLSDLDGSERRLATSIPLGSSGSLAKRDEEREENAAARLIGAVTEHPSVGHAPCQGSLVEIAAVDASPVYRYSLMPVRELNDRQRPVRMTTQPRARTVVIGLMT